MCRVKTKQRNRLLDVTLIALINVSINDPKQLNDDSALEVAQKWIKAKDRRRVKERALKTVKSLDDKEETNAFTDEHENKNFSMALIFVWKIFKKIKCSKNMYNIKKYKKCTENVLLVNGKTFVVLLL